MVVLGVPTAGRGRMTVAGPGRRRAVVALLAAGLAAGVCVVLATGSVSLAAAGGHAAAAQIRWGRAVQVPGLAALNKGYNARVSSLSCWAAGSCAAGGSYTDVHRHAQAFVVSERNGRWGTAEEVPGTAALNKGGNAQVSYVSCARTGACAAVGTYTGKAGDQQWFTAGERRGRWGKAARVPDPALNDASISTVWCAPGGLCAAGGSFNNLSNSDGAWVMTETHGRWHPAVEVPGLSALAVPGGTDSVTAVWCMSAGSCVAGGSYVFTTTAPVSTAPFYASSTGYSVFVVTEKRGVWGTAEEVPGIMGLNGGWDAGLTLLSCPSTGNCTAAGGYLPVPEGEYEACDPADPTCPKTFAVSERNGTWQNAQSTELGGGNALTCPSAGDCVLGGNVANTSSFARIVTETGGTWGKLLVLNASTVSSVSCSSAGYCAAGGENSRYSAFVATERNGRWGKTVTPAGIAAQYSPNFNNSDYAAAIVNAVACPPRIDLCAAGGFYPGHKGGLQAFLVSQR